MLEEAHTRVLEADEANVRAAGIRCAISARLHGPRPLPLPSSSIPRVYFVRNRFSRFPLPFFVGDASLLPLLFLLMLLLLLLLGMHAWRIRCLSLSVSLTGLATLASARIPVSLLLIHEE